MRPLLKLNILAAFTLSEEKGLSTRQKDMSRHPFLKNAKYFIILAFLFGAVSFSFAQSKGSSNSVEDEDKLTALQKEARSYRAQGLELQQIGNVDGALSYYQKAIELDPAYAPAHNDAGIIFEAKGMTESAQEHYLKAIKIDPYYLSTYSNIAFLYEGQRQLSKAAYYWRKRVELGTPDDPWTEKARERLQDVLLASSDRPLELYQQNQVMGLVDDVEAEKDYLKKDNKNLARNYFEKAKLSFKRGDNAAALKQAIDARQLDPSNDEIEEFLDKIQTRLLSK